MKINNKLALYDEVVKSPEFSDLDYKSKSLEELTARKVELKAETENSQEKIFSINNL